MSSERANQFFTDADGLFKSSKSTASAAVLTALQKQVKSLRSFLFKNQAARFSDGDREKLVNAIVLLRKTAAEKDGCGVQHTLPLVSDALKMPVSLFTAKHKDSLLKLYERDAGAVNEAEASAARAPTAVSTTRLVVIDVDVDEQTCTVLLDDEPRPMRLASADMAVKLSSSLDKGDECEADVDVEHELVVALL